MKIYTGNSVHIFRTSTIAEGTTIKDVQYIDIETEAWYDALYGKDKDSTISFVFEAEDNEYEDNEYEEYEFKTLSVGETFEPTVGIVGDYNIVETATIKTVSESEVTMLVNRNYQTCFGDGWNDSEANFIVTVDLQSHTAVVTKEVIN